MRKTDAKAKFISRSEALVIREEARKRHYPLDFVRHEGYEIVQVLEGACEALVEGKRRFLKPGTALFISEGEYHCVQVNSFCRFRYFDFRPQKLFSSERILSGFFRPFIALKISGSPAIMRCLEQAAHKAGKEPAGDEVAAEIILDLNRVFIRLIIPDETDQKQRARLKPALNLIHERYGEKLGVSELAGACAMSRPSFYRHFKKVFKRDPVAFINGIRLDQASALLVATDRKISDIAMETGFPNVSYFNRVFKKGKGARPGDYRKQHGMV